ncbi:uncharacterized protein VTP21DRAFT_945 [Calcarisporiella thermophila]|uniref:uncharacterized protein n=1 Tax=Calcarisporiella thermophila TaxID=911321 RepID=UPI0037441AC3
MDAEVCIVCYNLVPLERALYCSEQCVLTAHQRRISTSDEALLTPPHSPVELSLDMLYSCASLPRPPRRSLVDSSAPFEAAHPPPHSLRSSGSVCSSFGSAPSREYATPPPSLDSRKASRKPIERESCAWDMVDNRTFGAI